MKSTEIWPDVDSHLLGPVDRVSVDLALATSAEAFLDFLVRQQFVLKDALDTFLAKEALADFVSAEELGRALVAAGVLTPYQFDRITAGTSYGLVLGNHRVLECVGSGGMGTVFRGEHLFLRRPEALKVLPVDDASSQVQLERFYGEMRVLAELHH